MAIPFGIASSQPISIADVRISRETHRGVRNRRMGDYVGRSRYEIEAYIRTNKRLYCGMEGGAAVEVA